MLLVAKAVAALAALGSVAAPSLHVDRDAVSPGASVRVSGKAAGCPAVARASASAGNGRYLITARCGGGNLGVAAAVYVTRAPLETVCVRGGGVSGTIGYHGVGSGTAAWVRLTGLPARTGVRVLLHAGTWARHGLSFALVAQGRASAAGAFAAHGRVLFHGQPVDASGIADGQHVFVVLYATGKGVCAPIPGVG